MCHVRPTAACGGECRGGALCGLTGRRISWSEACPDLELLPPLFKKTCAVQFIGVGLSGRHSIPCHRTPNPNFETPNPKPQTPNPKPQTPHTTHHTPRPTPQTPNPNPQTPNPKPQTPNPKPQTLTSTPSTLNPPPQTARSGEGAEDARDSKGVRTIQGCTYRGTSLIRNSSAPGTTIGP